MFFKIKQAISILLFAFKLIFEIVSGLIRPSRLLQIGMLREYHDDWKRFTKNAYLNHRIAGDEEAMLSRMTQLAHGIEKGLSFREPKQPFFLSKIEGLLNVTNSFLDARGIVADKRLVMVDTALQRYIEFHDDGKGGSLLPIELKQSILGLLDRMKLPKGEAVLEVNIGSDHGVTVDEFKTFLRTRRSIRDFSEHKIQVSEIVECIEMAMHSPSVCNRQSWRVVVLDDETTKNRALSFQNGNKGFGHEASQVLVVGCDLRSFCFGVERNQAFVDGGLFCMSLVYALHSKNIGSCCLNWCVPSNRDRKFRKSLGLEDWFRTTMLIAVGKQNESVKVPFSIRRNVEDIVEIR